MADVTLRLTADTSNYTENINKATKARQNLTTTSQKGIQREKGLIEDIEAELSRLEKARKKAWSIEDIERYNRKIAEARNDLQEYEKAGLKAEKQTESLTKSISKWALSLGGAAVLLKKLKDAFADTVQGMNLFNQVGAVTKQVMQDIVSTGTISINHIRTAILAQKELNEIRIQEAIELPKVAKANREYQEQWAKSMDQNLSGAEKLKAIDAAIKAHNEAINFNVDNTKKALAAYYELWKQSPDNEKYFIQVKQLQAKLDDLDAERVSGIKRLLSRRSGIIKEDEEERLKWRKDLHDSLMKAADAEIEARLQKEKEYQQLSQKLIDDYEKSNIERLKSDAELLSGDALIAKQKEILEAERDFALKEIDQFKKEMEAAGTLTDKQKEIFKNMALNIKAEYVNAMIKYSELTPEQKDAVSNALVGSLAELPGLQKSKIPIFHEDPYKEKSIWSLFGIDPEADDGKEFISEVQDAAGKIKSSIDDIYEKRVEDATRNRELLDTKVNELQQAVETETALYAAGFSSNVTLKKKELEAVQKERDEALKEEEKTIKRQRALEAVSQTASLLSSAASLIKSGTSKSGILGLVLAAGAIASMYAIWSGVKSKISDSTKLAEGGSGDDKGIIRGKRHYQGGERFADNIEVEQGEAWGVLNRRATAKYAPVFHEMVSSFNRGELPSITAPAVSVNMDTKGSNKRLDAVRSELQKVNKGLNKDIIYSGGKRIIHRGNLTQIINR